MFTFTAAVVPVRSDLVAAFRAEWDGLARPGAVLTSSDRVGLARTARSGRFGTLADPLEKLARKLYAEPGAVVESDVRNAADATSDAHAVEAIGIVSRLAAVDGFHRAMQLELEPLPEPIDGAPTGEIDTTLQRRRTHVPVAPGPIPYTLNHVPAEGRALKAIHGPQYMSYDEMDDARFARKPGLNRAQMELVSSMVSIHNQCFY